MTTLSKEAVLARLANMDSTRPCEEYGTTILQDEDLLDDAHTVITDLVAENERLKEENTAFRKAWNADQLFVELRAALAAAEADNERLRNALNEILTTDWVSDRVRRTAKTAIAQPRDDSALREMIAGVYAECAKLSDSYAYMSQDFVALSEELRALAEKAKGE